MSIHGLKNLFSIHSYIITPFGATGTCVSEYDLFVQRRKFTRSTRKLVISTFHIFVYIVVYFWFYKFIYSVCTSEGNPYVDLFK
jgi:hypothetical protein